MEPVVQGSVFIFSRFLVKFGQVLPSSDLGVKEVEVFIVVSNEFIESFVFRFECGIFHSVVPLLGEGDSLSSSHLAKDEGNLEFIGIVDSWVDQEICIHGFEPS